MVLAVPNRHRVGIEGRYDGVGLTEAREYIRELRKKQENPYLWPDYLTGLPDKAAIIHRLGEVYGELGNYGLAYIRVANVHPYLLKYGVEHHAEVVQWAAAILKTVADRHGRKNFVGALRTHDFIVIARADRIGTILKEAVALFRRRTERLYSESDRKNGFTISFKREKDRITIGLMKMIYVLATTAEGVSEGQMLPMMAEACDGLEASGDSSAVFSPGRPEASSSPN